MNINELAEFADELANEQHDINETKSGGGGEYEAPAAGPCMLRYIGYVEVGKVKKKPYKGKPKPDTFMAWHIFEVSGAKYPPVELPDGTKMPVRLTVKMNISSSDKAPYTQLFKIMNWENKARHFIQLLGQAFLGTITHYTFKNDEGKEVAIAQLVSSGDAGTTINIRPPFVEVQDPVEGTVTRTDVRGKIAPPLSALRLFLWNATPDKHAKMWENIYIPTPEGAERSRNTFQDAIRKATNFGGSNIEAYLSSAGILDVGSTADDGLGDAIDAASGAGAASAQASKAEATKAETKVADAPVTPQESASSAAQDNMMAELGLG